MTTKKIEEMENTEEKMIEIWKKIGFGLNGFSANQNGGTTMKRLRKLVTVAALAGALLCASPKAEAGSIEMTIGQQSTTVDTKVGGNFTLRTGYFLRNRTTSNYQGEVSNFGLLDLSANIVGGLDAVLETQAAPGMGVIPRLGVQYFRQIGDLSLYGIATISPALDVEGLVSATYAPKLSENTSLLLSGENITNVGLQDTITACKG